MRFSIIICCFNSRKDLLERALMSCLHLQGKNCDLILVDNNSAPPMKEYTFVQEAVKDGKLKLVHEKEQGLVFARMSGLEASTGEMIVFVDDDNVIDPDYLITLENLCTIYPLVAAWGPGRIKAEYVDGAPYWVRKHYGSLFQEKERAEIQFGCVSGWPDYYPAGSGLSVKREVLDEYARQVKSGKLKATGRKGMSLSSAEDSQLVWTGVKMGLAAGTAPALRLTHLIPGTRTTRSYLADLNYALGKSYHQALSESFPESKGRMKKRNLLSKVKFMATLFWRTRFNPLMFYRRLSIDSRWYEGWESVSHGKL